MRSRWAAALLMRRLRAEVAIVGLTVALVGGTSLVFAAAPRLLNRVADDGLRQAIESAPAGQRGVSLALVSEIGPRPNDGVGTVRELGDRLAARFPPALAAALPDRRVVVTTVRFALSDPRGDDTRIALRYQDGVTDAARIVEGRWPVDRGSRLRLLSQTGGPAQGTGSPGGTTTIEIALAKDAAADLGIKLGDTLAVTLDGTDPLVSRYRFGLDLGPTDLEVVGLYQPNDPSAEEWASEASLLQVVQGGTVFHPIEYATAYVPAESYPSLYVPPLPYRYEWRFAPGEQAITADQTAQLQVDVRALRARIGSVAVPSGAVDVQTGLPGILDRYDAEHAAAEAMLSIAIIGPFGLAGAAFAVLALLLVGRRRSALALARGRGASTSLVLGTQLWESIVLAGGAALAGLVLAVLLVPARASWLSPLISLVVGGAVVLLMVGASWTAARRPLGQVARDDPPVLRVGARRLVLEGTIVAISAGATLLLRQRGLTIDTASGLARSDPLLASVPVLSGLAAGIVVARLSPLPIRALGWLAARRRGIVPVLGFRTIGRQPAVANLSLLALMLTAAFGAFSSVVGSSIEHGQLVASYVAAGADYRVESAVPGPLPASVDVAAIPGVSAVAPGIVDTAALFSGGAGQATEATPIYAEAVAPRAYDAVAAGTPADPAWPAPFLADPTGGAVGTVDNPIPAILSTTHPGGSDLSPGDTFRMTVDGTSLAFRVVEERPAFPGIVGGSSFAVVPLNWVEAGVGAPVPADVLWLRASPDAGARVATALAAAGAYARIISRFDAYAALHDPPLASAIPTGFGLAMVLAAIYVGLTIIGAMVLSAARRTRDVAFLRTLGVSARQALGLTIVEQATTVVLAVVPGVALGVGVAMLCEPGLGLATFDGLPDVPLFVDWPVLALMVGALVGIVAVSVVIGTWLAARARLVDALRLDAR